MMTGVREPAERMRRSSLEAVDVGQSDVEDHEVRTPR
jgi:hypothetical protein